MPNVLGIMHNDLSMTQNECEVDTIRINAKAFLTASLKAPFGGHHAVEGDGG
jgi:hypothetical protein